MNHQNRYNNNNKNKNKNKNKYHYIQNQMHNQNQMHSQNGDIMMFPKSRFRTPYQHNLQSQIVTHDPNLIVMVVPKGKKYFLWLVDNSLRLVNTTPNNDIELSCPVDTNSPVFHGTIFYGTVLFLFGRRCFAVEDICQYEGTFINPSLVDFGTRLQFIHNSLQATPQHVHPSLSRIGVCFIYPTGYIIPYVPYPVYSIHYHHLINTPHLSTSIPLNQNQKYRSSDIFVTHIQHEKSNVNNAINTACKTRHPLERVFQVTAEIQPDTYQLHEHVGDSVEMVDYAMVPSYKISQMMNGIFRNIRENANLDLQEESDDESDFQDTSPCKYLLQGKTEEILCRYDGQYKMWTPVVPVVHSLFNPVVHSPVAHS